MKTFLALMCALLAALPLTAAPAPDPIVGDLTATPSSLTLVHAQRPHSLVVMARTKGGYDVDFTGSATFRSSNEKVARVSASGWVQPIANGSATLTVQASGKTAKVSVTVQLPGEPTPSSFRQDVMPVLSKGG